MPKMPTRTPKQNCAIISTSLANVCFTGETASSRPNTEGRKDQDSQSEMISLSEESHRPQPNGNGQKKVSSFVRYKLGLAMIFKLYFYKLIRIIRLIILSPVIILFGFIYLCFLYPGLYVLAVGLYTLYLLGK